MQHQFIRLTSRRAISLYIRFARRACGPAANRRSNAKGAADTYALWAAQMKHEWPKNWSFAMEEVRHFLMESHAWKTEAWHFSMRFAREQRLAGNKAGCQTHVEVSAYHRSRCPMLP